MKRFLCSVIVAGGLACLLGCDEVRPVEQRLGERAYQLAAELIATHPQREAGVHSEAVATWLAEQLGSDTLLQRFETPQGTMVNVVKRHPQAVAIVASHYDTKVGIPNFVGANDGASTTGLLLALAKETDWPITYLFLDGEECREAYSAKDGLHGSWHYAKTTPVAERLPVIVLDMLGDRSLQMGLAANGASALNRLIRRAAKRVGIPLADEGDIIDDHLPFMIEGWQAADIIDFDYGPENCWWHTADDTMDKVSATSLAQAATLVREVIDCLMKERK